MHPLEFLLEELSKLLKTPLKVDEHHTCKIRIKDKLDFYIELDRSQQDVIVGVLLASLPAGKYREQILKEALISNGEIPPSGSIFAYSKRQNGLVLFEKMPLQDLSADRLFTRLEELFKLALPWKEALERSEVPRIERKKKQTAAPNIFSLKKT